MELGEAEIWSALGHDGVTALVRRFYARVPSDDILGPLYPAHDFAGAEERLRDFLAFRLGGDPRYLETRGHPRLRQRHAPFAIDRAARERWMELMDEALDASELADPLRERLRAFLGEVATFLINRA